MYANGMSYVSSFGCGHSLMELIGEESDKNGDSLDPSTAAEVL